MDDLVILNGRNFQAAEIEGSLSDTDRIKSGRSVAFGNYNPERGSNNLIVVAELSGCGPSDEEVRQTLRQSIFEGLGLYPAEVVLVEPGWLIKTTSGKIARGGNAEKYVAMLKKSGAA